MSEGPEARRGARLRLARQARGFSQQQVASMAGVSRQAISAVESGVSDPSLQVALVLARTGQACPDMTQAGAGSKSRRCRPGIEASCRTRG